MPDNRTDQVFLSYAKENLDKVWEVYNGLKKRKLNVWFDEADLGLGRWKVKITKEINRSRYFVICISPAALKKTGDEPGFQDNELNTAYNIAQEQPDSEFTLIPVRLEDCGRGDFRLTGFQQYDLFNDFEKELDRLAVAMGGCSLSDAQARDRRTEEEKLIDTLMGKAELHYYAGELEKAISSLEAVLAIKPDKHDAWNNKGVALYELGRSEAAIKAYNEALKIKPDSHEAWYNKGVALYELGQREAAIEAFDEALKIKPNLHQAWYNKGNALNGLGQREAAVEAYDEALKIKPDYHEAWNNKGNALDKLGRSEAAIEAYDEAIKVKPDDHEAWYNKGLALAKLGRIKEAVEACEKALEIRPDYKLALKAKELLNSDLIGSNS